MDAIVNDLANDVARLANIGDPGFDVNQKRSDLQQVLRIDIGGRNVDPFALFQQDWQDIDVFNNEFINIGREITHFYQSQHGIINVGTRYKTYTDIRNEFQALYHQVFRSQTLTQEQKDILLFILLPGYYLPQYSPGYNPDKASVTVATYYSKYCRNLI